MIKVNKADMNWELFLDENWEKQPTVLSNPLDSPLVTKELLFDAMINAAESSVEENNRHIHMWLDNKEVISNYKDNLPTSDDGNLDNYFNRVLNQSEFFTYYQEKLESYSSILWEKAYNLVFGLVKEIGIPTDRIELDTFIGKYKSTPRGIHTDAASTFMYVLSGKKKMLVWPPDFFDDKNVKINERNKYHKTILEFDYNEVIEEAIVLEGEPGDIIYWPSTYWHLSVSDHPEELSAIFNVGLFYGDKSKSIFGEVISRSISNHLNSFQDELTYGNEEDQNLPLLELKEYEHFKKKVLSDELFMEMRELWYKKKSSLGFTEISGIQKTQNFDENTRFYVRQNHPFYWLSTEDTIKLFICGRMFRMKNKNGLSTILQKIKSTKHFTMDDLQKVGDSSKENEMNLTEIKSIVKALYSFHSLTLEKDEYSI